MKARNVKVTYCMLAYRDHDGVESGEWYGLSCRIIGSTVINPYTIKKSPIHQITNLNTSRSTLNRKMASPQKKRNSERCSTIGNPSTAHGICILSTPAAKNAGGLATGEGMDDRVAFGSART